MGDDDMYLDPEGLDCLTARQAAALTGRSLQTIYSWERRGLLKARMTDDQGRKVYLHSEIAALEGQRRDWTDRIRARQAA
jgi:DNA-binding transcriptional MerR regulator